MLGEPPRDHIVRALTDDGSFRVVAAATKNTVTEAMRVQDVPPALRKQFAEFLTATILVRDTMAPDMRLQTILQGDDNRSRLVADTQTGGGARGLIQLAKGKTEMPIANGGILKVSRPIHDGSLHQGIVGVPESGSIAGAFMRYMQESEQIVTMIAVGVHMHNDEVIAAGGYLVQILPEIQKGPLMVMTERLRDFEDIVPLLREGKGTPKELIEETFYGMPYTLVSEAPVQFSCSCSEERVALSLASLPKAEIESMIADGNMLELTCDYCRKDYTFHPERLRGALGTN
ncbi:MAG: Hsp33 family molecular chaperone HslO [Polyangiaceae bacterium]|nr:Hsp33 family molecular chaperone HslO [Polyangiaceae bacterium]